MLKIETQRKPVRHPSKLNLPTSSGGIYNLKEDYELQAKLMSLGRKVEALEIKIVVK